jgi:ABC-type lipoprotein export system ATPase subunit
VTTTEAQRRFVLEISGLEQVFRTNSGAGGFTVQVDGPLRIPEGGFVSIRGPNGCGKTTLMTVLALLRRPSNLDSLETFRIRISGGRESADSTTHAGEASNDVEYDLKQVWTAAGGSSRMGDIRRQYFGFCPQQLELLSALNVEETVGLSLRFNGWPRRRVQERVNKLLQEFELVEKRRNRIDNVSGGQQQKVTIARAIAHSPVVVFLDEPTAFLHVKTARQALSAMQRLQQESGGRTTVVMITHDNDLAEEFSTTIINMEGDGTRGWVSSVEERAA